jgi:dienelactone hydrolase
MAKSCTRTIPVLFLFLTFFLNRTANAKIITKTVEYNDGSTVLEGKVAYDDANIGLRPGILVVHEWTGLGTYVTSRIQKLAKLGYIAFAADIYGKGVRPTTPQEAGKTAGIYKNNRALLRQRVSLALEQLKAQPHVDVKKIAAIGYCFGGTTILELARSGADLKGFISFHGGLDTPTPNDAKNIKGEVLAFTGADDPHVPFKEVQAFEKEMREGHVKWELVTFGGAVHAFTNPEAGDDNSKGQAYNKDADLKSWEEMKLFLNRVFGA